MSRDYQDFIANKRQLAGSFGFEPTFLPDWMFDFQKALVEWATRKGKAAIFADCGLGKTPMQLVWAENVVRKTNRPVLILTPLAVSYQTVGEAEKFGIEAKRSGDGSVPSKIVVTNYERLGHFSPHDFSGVVCDESSRIKSCDSKTKADVTEFMRLMPYRLLCTATASPNDYIELGTSSEALGYLGYQDMITRFFKQETGKDHLGWGRSIYRFRGHSEEPFWQWVCSWARVCRRPSDLGFDDRDFVLPRLIETESKVSNSTPREGMLFSTPAMTMQEQREERRITIAERCEQVAAIANAHDGASVAWCHLNDEGDLLSKLIDDAEQVSGSMPDEEKEEKLLAFQRGEIKRLVTKPKIGCFGLNWQHCHNVITFPSHSWEQYYQAVRRCLRFGQKHDVRVHVVTTEGEIGVMKNLQRKALQAERMFDALCANANNALHISRNTDHKTETEIPSWL